jgi:hypothetical protein
MKKDFNMTEPNSFEEFIIQCCEMDEWDLRDFLRGRLTEAGFEVQEDDYVSHRPGKYKTIRNMLAIRGTEPSICLVAHTDVCRDHGAGFRGGHQKANPVVKTVSGFNGNEKRIIQDKDCRVQTGGDDRLGVAINTWIALNTGYDMGLLFTTDEEVGAISADYVNFPELGEFEVLVEVDRGNHSNQLVTSISGVKLCDGPTAARLLGISEEIGLPRVAVQGLLTDVLSIKGDGKCKNAVNMTCGYHNSFGSSSNEYIDIEEAKNTMKFVSSIINDYEMEKIDELNNHNEGGPSEPQKTKADHNPCGEVLLGKPELIKPEHNIIAKSLLSDEDDGSTVWN